MKKRLAIIFSIIILIVILCIVIIYFIFENDLSNQVQGNNTFTNTQADSVDVN